MQSVNFVPPASMLMDSSMPVSTPGTSENDIATDFESLIISQLLKQMRSSAEDGGMFPGDKSDTYGGMFDMYFGKFLAENGGLGLADFVSEGIHATINREEVIEETSGALQSGGNAA